MTGLLAAASSCLVVVDVQEGLAPATADPEGTIRNATRLLAAAARLGVPAIATEQYPAGIGPTVAALAAPLAEAGARTIEKTHFAAPRETAFAEAWHGAGRTQAVIVGMEAHVCVLQTALDLAHEGAECFVVADAVTSRAPADRDAALARLRDRGVDVVTTEMALFEWIARGDASDFRAILALIK